MKLNIVEDTLNEFGLRTLHAVDFNAPISRDAMRELVPMEGMDSLGMYPLYDKELMMHHLIAVWNAREVVDFSRVNQFLAKTQKTISRNPTRKERSGAQSSRDAEEQKTRRKEDQLEIKEPKPIEGTPLRYGVMWWIGKGETMSLAIELAAQLRSTSAPSV